MIRVELVRTIVEGRLARAAALPARLVRRVVGVHLVAPVVLGRAVSVLCHRLAPSRWFVSVSDRAGQSTSDDNRRNLHQVAWSCINCTPLASWVHVRGLGDPSRPEGAKVVTGRDRSRVRCSGTTVRPTSMMWPSDSSMIGDRSWHSWRTLDSSCESTMGYSASGRVGWHMQTPSTMSASSSRRIPDVRAA